MFYDIAFLLKILSCNLGVTGLRARLCGRIMNILKQQITTLEQKILAIDIEREVLFQELSQLKQQSQLQQQSIAQLIIGATITQQSSSKDKVNLFRNLFKGREDLYPKRFVSSKTGKSGYAPVCANEWIRCIKE